MQNKYVKWTDKIQMSSAPHTSSHITGSKFVKHDMYWLTTGMGRGLHQPHHTLHPAATRPGWPLWEKRGVTTRLAGSSPDADLCLNMWSGPLHHNWAVLDVGLRELTSNLTTRHSMTPLPVESLSSNHPSSLLNRMLLFSEEHNATRALEGASYKFSSPYPKHTPPLFSIPGCLPHKTLLRL